MENLQFTIDKLIISFFFSALRYVGGVFVTWRQKDPKEPDLGLYGKNSKRFNMIAECNDIPLVGISDVDDDIFAEERPKNKRPNIANNRTILNSVWKMKSKFQCARK